ncbi:dynamin family domain-containing protein [Purpureocillium lavendulum]|uniref:Dynamin family domain-containing protein n=1 Tax=Purpureocillium lavendulum TaxID=1247861 RepID=A0AB34FBL0_9HYPO|nr:dynamin family domain-containing protein [Purpureocillium lavendulum]
MGRPPNPIDQYRDYVSALYLDGVSRSKIRYKLRRHFHVAVDLSTITRRIAKWGLPRQQSRTCESPELVEAIRDLIFRVGLTEKQTLKVLQRQGWTITARGLKRIRLHPDRRWVRRVDSDEERLALLAKTEQVIIEMTQRSNAIAGYGRRLLQPYLRQQKQLWVPRDPLFEMYKIMFPNKVEMRKRMMRRKKGQFLVPGPNYQWCIDGHDKLKAYGFEIYAAIDAYSRNIIWLYVGHSATTALSVLKQYLAACDAYGIRPWYLQADRGRETPLIAAAHWNFALAAEGRVEWNGRVFQQGKLLRDSYKATPSTKNIKIESWWERMLHVSSRQWVDYFGELARDGDFDGDMLEDQIAMYAVFEDVLRHELFDFVEAWNVHRIRLQKNRPHVVHGQPWMNYHYPDPEKACNWGIPIDRSVLSEVARPLADIDISSSLEPETKRWCSAALTEMGYDEVLAGTHPDLGKLRPFKRFYLGLRGRIIDHLEGGRQPVLAYRKAPTGGVAEYQVLLDRANEAQQVELAEAQPAEEPLVELGYADEEGKDIECLSSNEGDEADEGIYDAASE